MINWIAGHTDRFQALVCHDGNLDERMAYFDTEELWFPEWEHGGPPWENPEGYAKHNPIDYVKNWKTPTLVIHGALDYRVVDTQGMSTFTALQRRGIPSKLLLLPRREPLGPEAAEQHPLARHGARMDRPLGEEPRRGEGQPVVWRRDFSPGDPQSATSSSSTSNSSVAFGGIGGFPAAP